MDISLEDILAKFDEEIEITEGTIRGGYWEGYRDGIEAAKQIVTDLFEMIADDDLELL